MPQFVPDSDLSEYWQAITENYRCDETRYINNLCQQTALSPETLLEIHQNATTLIQSIRQSPSNYSLLEKFLAEYPLSSEEGIALMSLAEALLRIPDTATRDKLIREKLTIGKWKEHRGKSPFMLVNAATTSLVIMEVLQKWGEPLVRAAVTTGMKILGDQFVMGQTIEAALKRSDEKQAKDYWYSFDMLGEAALTEKDGDQYFARYRHAINVTHKNNEKKASSTKTYKNENPSSVHSHSGISVKLSALEPRFQISQMNRCETKLYPRLRELVLTAKDYNIGITIDAEESPTLIPSLLLINRLLSENNFEGWEGLGIAVQAYQKRAPAVIDWLIALAKKYNIRVNIRLVKGAYWDWEIKQAQVLGLEGYAVLTRKVNTDLNYQYCAQKLLAASPLIYPQFATHNAYTVATIQIIAKKMNKTQFEFQRLYGMGQGLYNTLIKTDNIKCRVYAPVGSHEDLLSYLVRRLLENGANTSFVNQLIDQKRSIASLVRDPYQEIINNDLKYHPNIPLPHEIYYPQRPNSKGFDLSDPVKFIPFLSEIHPDGSKKIVPVKKNINSKRIDNNDLSKIDHVISMLLTQGKAAFIDWGKTKVEDRAKLLNKMATLLEENRLSLMQILIEEGGKTIDDAINEVREAVDYCYYYAEEAKDVCDKEELMSPTGEENTLTLHPRGLILCISPWNFPLAIFLGQIIANLAVGNTVLAKPASATIKTAQATVNLLYEAGFPENVIQLLPYEGRIVSEQVVSDSRVQGIVFTGSTETAKDIQLKLAQRSGAMIPFIAETGGINVMIVDASALAEQVIPDIITSAFKSAGQRCSALRVLMVQEEVADKIITMLKGAMATLVVGDPRELSTDVGPVINERAKKQLVSQINILRQSCKLVYECDLPAALTEMSYVAPILFETSSLLDINEEIFGPVLQVVRYHEQDFLKIINDINQMGYGLTMGIESRIQSNIHAIFERAKVGNIYVNRSMIGAVVGVQPFGGEGLSGTGPKAGGPYMLPRLMVERTVSVNTTAQGGNVMLYMLDE